MLDKGCRDFLSFLDGRPENTFLYDDSDGYPDSLGDESQFFALVRYLEKLGYIEIIKSNMGNPMGVRLSYKGIKRKAFRCQEMLRYIEEKWIDFFALLVSVAALITSIAAITSQAQG